jgi:RNA polymerase sigma-70 factor (ECF subfamily)
MLNDLPVDEVSNLLTQIEQGADKAAKQLYEHYFGFVYAFVRHKVPADHAAEDVTQDIFLSVFLKPRAFAGHSKFSSWLCGIAKNKCVDWWRKNPDSVVYENDDEQQLDEQLDPNWDFVANLQIVQDHEALRHCVDKLPTHQREAVFWTYFQDEGVDVVARQLGCPAGTVKSRLFNARKRLHDCMSHWIAGTIIDGQAGIFCEQRGKV